MQELVIFSFVLEFIAVLKLMSADDAFEHGQGGSCRKGSFWRTLCL